MFTICCKVSSTWFVVKCIKKPLPLVSYSRSCKKAELKSGRTPFFHQEKSWQETWVLFPKYFTKLFAFFPLEWPRGLSYFHFMLGNARIKPINEGCHLPMLNVKCWKGSRYICLAIACTKQFSMPIFLFIQFRCIARKHLQRVRKKTCSVWM